MPHSFEGDFPYCSSSCLRTQELAAFHHLVWFICSRKGFVWSCCPPSVESKPNLLKQIAPKDTSHDSDCAWHRNLWWLVLEINIGMFPGPKLLCFDDGRGEQSRREGTTETSHAKSTYVDLKVIWESVLSIGWGTRSKGAIREQYNGNNYDLWSKHTASIVNLRPASITEQVCLQFGEQRTKVVWSTKGEGFVIFEIWHVHVHVW
jgi:hypothetical protein